MRLLILRLLQTHLVCSGSKFVERLAHYTRRHGPISECPLTSTESFVLEYMQLPEGSSQRELLERRYGKTNLSRLVAKYEEDQANKKWLDQSTMACPSCHIKVEKSVGCNHVSTVFTTVNHCADLPDTDDMRAMRSTFLLPLWGQAHGEQSLSALFNAWTPVLFQAVRLSERRERVAACGRVRVLVRRTGLSR